MERARWRGDARGMGDGHATERAPATDIFGAVKEFKDTGVPVVCQFI